MRGKCPMFDNWLDGQANLAMQKVVWGEKIKGLSLNEVMVLAVKGQTSYLARMRKELRDG